MIAICPTLLDLEPWTTPRTLRRFVLRRHGDVSGVSGTGDVAQGIEFGDGVVVLRWCSGSRQSVVFHEHGVESVLAVHGHEGRTEIAWLD